MVFHQTCHMAGLLLFSLAISALGNTDGTSHPEDATASVSTQATTTHSTSSKKKKKPGKRKGHWKVLANQRLNAEVFPPFGPHTVENMRNDQFDGAFRDDLKRFLESQGNPTGDVTISVPAEAIPSSWDVPNVNEIDASRGTGAESENYATVLREFIVKGKRTRVVFVRRGRAVRPSNTDASENNASDTLQNEDSPTSSLPSIANPVTAGGMPLGSTSSVQASSGGGNPFAGATILRAGVGGLGWGDIRPTSPQGRRARLQAEMRFRQFEDQLDTVREQRRTGSPGTKRVAQGASASGSGTRREDGVDQVIIIEAAAPTRRPSQELRADANTYGWQGDSLTWGTVARSFGNVARTYPKRILRRMGVVGFIATATSVLLILFLLHKKRAPHPTTQAMRVYRNPVTRRARPAQAPIARPAPEDVKDLAHPFALLTDGQDHMVWNDEEREIPLRELDEKEQEAHSLLNDVETAEEEDEEQPTVTGEIQGAEFRTGVQVSFDPKLCRWAIKKYSPMGNAAEVLAVLQPGTVVRGAILRTSNGAQRYRLTPTGTWIPTCEAENLILAVSPAHFGTGDA